MNAIAAQETEVVPKAKRRKFTAQYKRDIVKEVNAAQGTGEIGAILRREGLYSSHLTKWREEIDARDLAALEPKKRGPKSKVDPQAQEMAALRREMAVLKARAERAELLVEIQKKVSMILGIELPKIDEER